MQGRTTAILVVLLAALSACRHEKSPAEQASEDARDIAMVEAAQDAAPPPVPLEPQPITAADIEKNGLYGVGCSLVPAAQPGGDPLVMLNDKRAVMKLGGKFVTFAADPGSGPLALGARSHYVGKAQSLFVQKSPGEGTRIGEESMRWDGSVVVRDAHDQQVFTATGQIVCGS